MDFLVALGIAFLLGLRHASDPDQLVTVTSLVAAEQGDTRNGVLTRPVVEPVYRTVLIPCIGVFGVTFGLWYAGLA